MLNIQLMFDTVKKQNGGIPTLEEFKWGRMPSNEDKLKESRDKDFFSAFSQTNHFVFDFRVPDSYHNIDEINDETIPNAPFSVFSLENLQYLGDFAYKTSDGETMFFKMKCILGKELTPNIFDLHILLMTHIEGRGQVAVVVKGFPMHSACRYFFDKLRSEQKGVAKEKMLFRHRDSNNKRVITKIKNIIYVRPKTPTDVASFANRNINWSHQWNVIGHWRIIQGIGKDREGNYGTKGFTWVTEHQKGPETTPIIKKMRIVQSGTNNGVLESITTPAPKTGL